MSKTRTATCLALVAASLLLAIPSASADVVAIGADGGEQIVFARPGVVLHVNAAPTTVTIACNDADGVNTNGLVAGTYFVVTAGVCFYRGTQFCAWDTTYVKEDCGTHYTAPATLLINGVPLAGGEGAGLYTSLGGTTNVKYRDSVYTDNSGLLQVTFYKVL